MKKRIMVVEKADFLRKIISDTLQKNGYEVVAETTEGNECVKLYRELQPDLVILGALMNDQTSFLDILPILIKEEPPARVVVTVTFSEQGLDALKLGAVSCLRKPFKPEKLVETVGQLCS